MKLIAKVTLEHSDGRTVIRPQTVKDVLVELCVGETKFAPPILCLAIKPKELIIPIQRPCTLYGHLSHEGRLGLRFPKYKVNPWDSTEKSLQINIHTMENIEELLKLRAAINTTLTKGIPARHDPKAPCGPARRPLSSLNSRQLNSSSSAFSTLHSSSSGTFSIAGVPQREASSADSRDSGAEECLPSLSSEQSKALDMVIRGKSIFFTGSAGTGKSLLLRHIIKALPKETTYVTGLTGLAGCLLGGTTINSFAGIGRGEGDIDALIKAACRGESAVRWRKATTLIIDEISMMDGKTFDLLERIAREVRGSNRPFGGIQLILSGDFHQLPPVAKGKDAASTRSFCFESSKWLECIDSCVMLTQVFRQEDDEFVDILSSIRSGDCSPVTLRSFISRCSRPLDLDDGILPTQLFTHRADVDSINDQQLRALSGETVTLKAHDMGDTAALNAACPAKSTLQLKVGAQVMLIKNIDSSRGLVNGARGVVEKFTNSGLPVVRFAACERPLTIGRERWNVNVGGRVTAQRDQVPLALAWAVTVHKSQGLTLDRVEVNLERAFESGMAYVALSRVKCMEGLRIIGNISPSSLRADPKVKALYKTIVGC